MIAQQIIKDCIHNKANGHKKLYEGCLPYVYSIVKRYIKSPEERKDQVQEIFASVFQNINQFDSDKGAFKSWIARICVNQCLMSLRKNKNLSSLNIVEITEINEPSEEVDLSRMTREDIEKILHKMPSGYKIVFMLNVIDGYNHTEIQEMLSISKDTSRSQLSRAKKWIRKHLTHNINKTAYGIF